MAVKAKRCSECGVELKLDPASCPLCGSATGTGADWSKRAPKATKGEVLRFKPTEPEEVDDYQAKLRKLRDSLKELREDAREA